MVIFTALFLRDPRQARAICVLLSRNCRHSALGSSCHPLLGRDGAIINISEAAYYFVKILEFLLSGYYSQSSWSFGDNIIFPKKSCSKNCCNQALHLFLWLVTPGPGFGLFTSPQISWARLEPDKKNLISLIPERANACRFYFLMPRQRS